MISGNREMPGNAHSIQADATGHGSVDQRHRLIAVTCHLPLGS